MNVQVKIFCKEYDRTIEYQYIHMTCAYLLGTFTEVPGTDQTNFVVLGTYPDKDSAKAAVGNLAPAMMQDQYKNGITLYKLEHDSNKMYTFQKKDLQSAYDEIQKQQQHQLEQQLNQLQQQQEQLKKQLSTLKSGDGNDGNVRNAGPTVPTPTVAPTVTPTPSH